MFENIEQNGDKDAAGGLYALAEARAGYVTARRAVEAGIARSTLSHHARPGGRLVHVARGLYRLRDFPSSPHEHIVADQVHVTVPRAQRRKPIEGVVIHPTTFPITKRQRRDVLGIPVTTVDRTIIDVLRSVGMTEQVEAAVAEALRRGRTTERRLRATAAKFPQTVQRQIAELTA